LASLSRQVAKFCELCRVDPHTGRREDVAFCPGFLRGLTFVGSYAIVTLSLPRRGRFQGLALDDALARRGAEPWCGLMIIDTRHGDVVEWVRFAHESELFDVAAIPLTRCPTAIAPDGSDMQDVITFEDMTSSRGNAVGAFSAGEGAAPQELPRHAQWTR